MALRVLPTDLREWREKTILVRVDWNVPLQGVIDGEGGLKIKRSLSLIHRLQYAGAKIVLMTHLGRPTSASDKAHSTKHLLPLLKKEHLSVVWIGEDIMKKEEREQALETLKRSKPGSVFLLENVRFYPGEEKNSPGFVEALSAFGEVFVNDAFAVSHRAHASVVGVAARLPAYAGSALEEEVEHIQHLMEAPKQPFIAFIGGGKISTKIQTINALRKKTQALYLGGAMALVCEAARGKKVGSSNIESGQKAIAQQLLAHKNIRLPVDYIVADTIGEGARQRVSDLSDVEAHEYVVDIGPRTLVAWSEALRSAGSVLWNGPVGITEIPAFGAGSRGLARFLGYMPHSAQVLVGGGDTIPILGEAGVIDRIGFVSTGGGAMLDFLVQGMSLPGLSILQQTAQVRAPRKKRLSTPRSRRAT